MGELGTDPTLMLLNQLVELEITDENIGDSDYAVGSTDEFFPLATLDVQETVPETRINLREKRIYRAMDADVELSFSINCTQDTLPKIWGDDWARRSTTGVRQYPRRILTFRALTEKVGSTGTPGKVEVKVTCSLLGRSISARPNDPDGAVTASMRLRVLGTDDAAPMLPIHTEAAVDPS